MEDSTHSAEKRDGLDVTPAKRTPDFRAIRESRGLSLKDIYEHTRISVVNLEAIENEDFQLLPPPVFTKAFIKTYAKLMGIDGSETLARYEESLHQLQSSPQKAEVKVPPPIFPAISHRYFIWAALILAGVGIVFFSIFSYKSEVTITKGQIVQPIQATPETKPPKAAGPTAEVKSESVQPTTSVTTPEGKDMGAKDAPQMTQAVPSEAQKENAPTAVTGSGPVQQQAETGEIYRLTMEAKELTWVRITAGQQSHQDILLRPGERINQSASNFVIIIGNAGGINVEFQGKSLGNLGRQGQVVHLKLPQI